MWNLRVTLTVVFSAVLLVAACALLGLAYAPRYAERRDTRQTQSAHQLETATAAVTQAVGATELAFQPTQTAIAGATETWVARPTITPTPTQTPTPTPTPTPTLPPAITECPATVTGEDRRLYPVPGGGQLQEAVELDRGAEIAVIGRLPDRGWVQVLSAEGLAGWMRGDSVSSAGGCQANIYSLAYLLGLDQGRQVVIDDTFISNENAWVNSAGEPLSPVLSEAGDAQLALTTNTLDVLHPASPRVQDLPVFTLVTSFARSNFFSDSYVGLRFRAGSLTAYELRISRNCQVAIFATGEQIFSRPVDPGANTCQDEQPDFLRLSFSDDNRLAVQLNDADPFDVLLEDPEGFYAGGGIEFVVNRARATFSFVVVTVP